MGWGWWKVTLVSVCVHFCQAYLSLLSLSLRERERADYNHSVPHHPPTHRKLFKHLEVTYSQVWYIIGIVSSSPFDFHSEKIGLIRVTMTPLSVLGLTLSLFSFLRPECTELDFKEIFYLVKYVYDFLFSLVLFWKASCFMPYVFVSTISLIYDERISEILLHFIKLSPDSKLLFLVE